MKTKQGSFFEKNRRSGGYLLKNRIKKGTVSVVRWLLVFGLCFMIIQPLLIRLSTAVMPEKDLYDSTIVLVPRNFTLDNFRIVFDLTGFPGSMLNSLWTSLLMAVCQVVSCTLVSYGFARYEFPLKKFWFGCVLATIIIPPQTYATSLHVFFTNFDIGYIVKLINGAFEGRAPSLDLLLSGKGIIASITGKTVNLKLSALPYVFMSLTCTGLKNGLYIYILMQYFKGVPKSLEEAAYVDGCGTLHTFTKIMLPDAVPVIVSCFLFAFVWQWTDLFYTRNFLSSMSIYSTQLSTIVSRMSRYFSTNSQAVVVPVGRQQQLISIAVVVCSTPLIIIYAFSQKLFVESIAVTGMKM